MMNTRTERDTGPDGIGLVPLQQHLDSWDDGVVAAASVQEDAHFVVEFAIAVDTDSDSDAVLREEIDDLLRQQRRIGSEAELDVLAGLGALPPGVIDRRAQHRKV